MMKKLYPILLVVLLSVSLAQIPFNADSLFVVTNVTWGTSTSPLEVGPGDKNVVLTVSFLYQGRYTATKLRAELNLPNGFTDTGGSGTATVYAVNIAKNTMFSLTFNLNIGASASLATYAMSLHFVFDTVASTDSEETITVYVPLKGKSELTFEVSNTNLNPGQTNEFTVTLSNTGTGNVNDIAISVSAPSSVTVLTKLPTISSLSASSSTTFDVSLYVSSAAANSPVSVTFSASYIDAYLNSRSASETLGFIVKPIDQSSFVLSASPRTLTIGETNQIKITLENTGVVSLKNTSITVSPASPVTLIDSDGKFSIGTLNTGASTDLTMNMYVSSTTTTTASVTLSISYIDQTGTQKTESRTLNFFITSSGERFYVINSMWGTSSTPTEVGPGDPNSQLTLTIQYFGNATIQSLHGTLMLPNAFTNIDGDQQATADAASIAPNSIFQLPFALNVADNASIGSYTIPLTLNWNTTFTKGITQTEYASVNLKGKAKLTLSTEDILNPGQVNTINVKLNNEGTGAASQISVSVTAPAGVSILNQISSISALAANSTYEITLKAYISSSSAGAPVTFTFTMTYEDAYGNSKSSSQSLGFNVKNIESISSISLNVQPTSLIAGKANNITVAVKNIADSPIHSISLSFAFSSGSVTWLQPDIAQEEELASGQSFIIQAKAYDPPATTASVTLQISIKYYDDNNVLYQETRNIGLLSQGLIDIKVTDFSVLPEQITPGQIFSITGTITNIGTITASAVTAAPHLPEGFIMFGSRSVFIGDMAVNTPTTFTISIQAINTTKPNKYQIPVELSYNDNLRNPLSTTLSVPVDVVNGTSTTTTTIRPTTSSWGIMSILPYIIVAAIALVVGYLVGKRAKKQ
jgi:uncharacterized repeat protein (TIGR01451 family)